MSHADVCMARIICEGPEGPGTHNEKRGLGVFLTKETLSPPCLTVNYAQPLVVPQLAHL